MTWQTDTAYALVKALDALPKLEDKIRAVGVTLVTPSLSKAPDADAAVLYLRQMADMCDDIADRLTEAENTVQEFLWERDAELEDEAGDDLLTSEDEGYVVTGDGAVLAGASRAAAADAIIAESEAAGEPLSAEEVAEIAAGWPAHQEAELLAEGYAGAM